MLTVLRRRDFRLLFVRPQTLLQVSVSDAYRGRVLGAYGTTQSALLLAGMALAGVLGSVVGPVPTLELAGLLYATGGVVLAFVLPRALQVSEARAPGSGGPFRPLTPSP